MDNEFLNNPIPVRARIIKEDKDPIHIYELLQKHFINQSINDLKVDYEVRLDIVRSRVFITGSEEKIYTLLVYLESRGCKFESVEKTQLRIDLDHFVAKIF